MPSAADAETMAFQTRINQEFVPNESLEADLVYADVPVLELPDPEQERLKKEAEEAAKAAESKKSSSGAAPRYTGGGSPAEWMAAAGISPDDWGYVDYIASRESTWNPNATNASSGACGLIQAYPCSKVPGNGYDPVDNLRWANGYAQKYGGWAGAYDFWLANHWW